ncbi:hypothetical protein TNCV_4936711 [Trichonephila clavipes]|nr:hypothetical protein TNCV_4936711 [Trichonephila clavipes]
MVETRVRVLMPLKSCREEGLMRIKFDEAENRIIGVMWKFIERDANSHVFRIAYTWFKLTRALTNCPHDALDYDVS